MEDSSSPTKFPAIWANAATAPYINTIPTASQISIKNGAASLHDGFPPSCFIAYAAGGAGPFGGDTNGILQQITAGIQWLQAGGPLFYDSAFSTAIGGYPQGAILSNASILGSFWISTIDNNTSDPDTGGSNWLVFPIASSIQKFLTNGSYVASAGVTKVKYRIWAGAGGAGGAANTNGAGGGGGGGGYSEGIAAVTPGNSYSVIVGSGGSGGSGGANGTNGGPSSFASFASTTGGGGGGFGNAFGGVGGSGGTATGGTINFPGGVGGPGGELSGGGFIGGFQGSSFCGPGVPGGTGTSLIQTLAGQFPGVGGQGGITTSPGQTQQGGNGAAGLVIIEELP
jgi:hypothetical protein